MPRRPVRNDDAPPSERRGVGCGEPQMVEAPGVEDGAADRKRPQPLCFLTERPSERRLVRHDDARRGRLCGELTTALGTAQDGASNRAKSAGASTSRRRFGSSTRAAISSAAVRSEGTRRAANPTTCQSMSAQPARVAASAR